MLSLSCAPLGSRSLPHLPAKSPARTPPSEPGGSRCRAAGEDPETSVTKGLEAALKVPKELGIGGTAAAQEQSPHGSSVTTALQLDSEINMLAQEAASYTPLALLRTDAARGAIEATILEQWERAYRQMAVDARQIGIPASAIPLLPESPTAADLWAARDQLEGIIASFLSAGL